MPIHAPGIRSRHGKSKSGTRNAIANLSLTAMVDMFTVLTIFLLQNYKETGDIIKLRNDVELPKATQIRELEPANIVIISKNMIILNENNVIPVANVQQQGQWLIYPLYQFLKQTIDYNKATHESQIRNKLQGVVAEVQQKQLLEKDFSKITLQADKDTDFLTIKKIMYTLTEAGASEIHFAVITVDKKYDEIPKEKVPNS